MKAVEDTISDLIQSRRAVGLKKYGIGVTERSDLTTEQWIQHAIEEALDFAIYLEKIKRELQERLDDGDESREANRSDFTPLWIQVPQ